MRPGRDELHGFKSHQYPNDAYNRPKDAAFAAWDHSLRRWWRRKNTSVAGATSQRPSGSWPAEVEAQKLALGPKCSAGDQRLSAEHGSIGYEIAGRWMVGAVENEIILGEERERSAGLEVDRVQGDFDTWIQPEALQANSSGCSQ